MDINVCDYYLLDKKYISVENRYSADIVNPIGMFISGRSVFFSVNYIIESLFMIRTKNSKKIRSLKSLSTQKVQTDLANQVKPKKNRPTTILQTVRNDTGLINVLW